MNINILFKGKIPIQIQKGDIRHSKKVTGKQNAFFPSSAQERTPGHADIRDVIHFVVSIPSWKIQQIYRRQGSRELR